MRLPRRLPLVAALLVTVVVAMVLFGLFRGSSKVPAGAAGTLVFVSDRSGEDALYVMELPSGRERQMLVLDQPVREPVIAPDGRRVAFSSGGRIGVVSLASCFVRMLTLGVEWHDSSPAWSPDGRRLVVAARRTGETHTDLHLLSVKESGQETGRVKAPRTVLTDTPGRGETEPVFGPDGTYVVFVREHSLVRLDLTGQRTRRLTQGLQKARHPRFLPSGRLVFLWAERKTFGLSLLEPKGGASRVLWTGTTYYRTLAPSPDGRFLAATRTYDLGFDPLEALTPKTEEVHLLTWNQALLHPLPSNHLLKEPTVSDQGPMHPLARNRAPLKTPSRNQPPQHPTDDNGLRATALVRSWRHSNHSPSWGP